MRGVLRSCGCYVDSVNTILDEVWTDTAAAVFLKGSSKWGEKNWTNILRQIFRYYLFHTNTLLWIHVTEDLVCALSHNMILSGETWHLILSLRNEPLKSCVSFIICLQVRVRCTAFSTLCQDLTCDIILWYSEFLYSKYNTNQAELTPGPHTHTMIYNSPGPVLYPLKPNCQTLNSTTAEQLGSTSVPTNPMCKTPGLLWLCTSLASNVLHVLCQLLFDCQTRFQNGLYRPQWDANPVQAGWWLLRCHRKRHHPIKICSFGHIGWSQIRARNF